MDPQIIDSAKWALGGLGALFSLYVSYKLGKRGKVDDLFIKRRHDLVERLSVALQDDFETREVLRSEYESNFGHVDEFKAMEVFNRYDDLYQGMRNNIQRCAELLASLRQLRREVAIYVKPKVAQLVEQYIACNQFTFDTDGGLLINTYAEEFFRNLLDESKHARRETLFRHLMKELRSAHL